MTYITKLIAILMSFFYMFMGGNPDKVTLNLAEQPTADSEYLYIEIDNYSGKTVWIDESIVLEKEIDGEWIEVPTAEGFGFSETAIQVKNCNSYTIKINLVNTYGHKLEKGSYRILAYKSAELKFCI